MSKVFLNASEIVSPRGKTALRGNKMNEIARMKCAVVVDGGIITNVGEYAPKKGDEVIDCKGGMVLPAFVDSHTHLVFGGERSKEFGMRLRGASYADIMAAGGGIAATTQATKALHEDELLIKAEKHLRDFVSQGVLTIEAKSGYGLDLDTEMKQLRVAKRLNGKADIVSTFMGAHAIPKDFTSAGYIDYIIETVLPVVAESRAAEFCDIFVEKGAFNTVEAEKLLTAAKVLGFKLKMHADELNDLGGGGLAAKLNCVSADHLLYVSDESINALNASGTIATMLPLTAYSLMERYAPARKLIDSGCAVNIASDFNPGSCYSNSVPMLISLAAMYMKMTANEIITALTLNAAAAADRAHIKGSIEAGKQADLVILDVKTPDELIYYFGHNAVVGVYKSGEKIF